MIIKAIKYCKCIELQIISVMLCILYVYMNVCMCVCKYSCLNYYCKVFMDLIVSLGFY
jgi:hypothetical protein